MDLKIINSNDNILLFSVINKCIYFQKNDRGTKVHSLAKLYT